MRHPVSSWVYLWEIPGSQPPDWIPERAIGQLRLRQFPAHQVRSGSRVLTCVDGEWRGGILRR